MARLNPRIGLTAAAALAPAIILLACAKTPSVPPITSLDGRVCAVRPDLNTARSLLLTDKPLTVDLDESAACWQREDGGKSAYAVFRLPDSSEPYLVTVASQPRGETLFSPRLALLDEQGNVLRERPRDSFMFRGSVLSTGLRAQPGERYLIVASDPDSVGQRNSRIVGSVQQMTAATGTGGFVMIYTGSEANVSFTFAHNGSVTVSVEPMPKVN